MTSPNKIISISSIIIASLLLMIPSCKHSLIYDIPIPSGNECDTCAAGVVSFTEEILPVLQTNCAKSGCHDSISRREGIVTTNYQRLMQTTDIAGKLLNSEFWEEINNGNMPPYPEAPLSAEQKNLIKTWLEQGALNTTCKKQCGCDSISVSFSADIYPMMQRHCLACHTTGSEQGGVTLDGYNNMLVYVNNGRLLSSIRHESGVVAMPYNLPKLNDCKIAQLERWINDGAPQN